jgi:hypothetical protein
MGDGSDQHRGQADTRSRTVGRAVMILVVVGDAVLLVTNWHWFTEPIPQGKFGIVGQVIGGSAAVALVVRLGITTLLLAVIGSVLGLLFRGQLLSRFGQAGAENHIEPLDSMEATDTDVDARLGGVEDALKDLITYEKQQQEDDESP